jgi:hypothetical protein
LNPNAPLTPKEFAADVFGGKRSAAWVREECAKWIRTRGREGIAVISANRPYLIPVSEKARFSAPLVFTRALKCA